MGKKPQVKIEENGEVMEDLDVGTKGGKKNKKSKKKDYDEEDIARELEELTMEVNGEAPKPKPADDTEKAEENKPNNGEKSKKEKKKSKRRGKDDDDEDDLDDLLAQIESEYRGEKPLEKKKSTVEAVEDEDKKSDSLDRGSRDSSVKGDKQPKQKETSSSKTKKTNEVKKGTKEKPSTSNKKKEDSPPVEEVDESSKKKKGKAKEDKKKEEEEAKARKGKPNKKMLEAMKQMLEKKKEEEERMRKEMEEKHRQEEERIRQIEEQKRLEEERKERQKQKQKERMKRLKEEGKLLTPKQKMEQRRAKAMLEHLRAQGVMIPEVGEKVPTQHVSYKRQKRKKQEATEELGTTTTAEEKVEEPEEDSKDQEEEEPKMEVEEEEEDDVVDAWDQISESEEEQEQEEKSTQKVKEQNKKDASLTEKDASESDKENEKSENQERHTEAERKRERAFQRMTQRKAENEKKKSVDRLRAPVVCVLGHVDHGKTKILDKLRKTNVQEGEVGGITQQIGATNVPMDAIKSQTRMVRDFDINSIRLPGLLIIDTPGHESFSNLRSRGSSLCDIAILVVDITQGLEPQTIESINLLKTKKTPFIVALNKVDRVFDWDSHPSKDIREIIKLQNDPSKNDFDRRTSEVIQALNMQGLNAALFWENPDLRSYVSLVPTSAISGDGMGNLMALITDMCQKRLTSRLMFSEELQCTVLEVKTIQGHGTTIDVILVNGRLREGDTIILAGTEGPIVTQIRSLLIPKPMKEIRVKGQYDELKMIEASLGVKIAARELEKAIAGLNLQVAHHEDEIEILKEEVDKEFKSAMRSIKVKDKGVYVQASTLGALEALLEFFKANKVPYSGIRVGPVVKRDVMKAAAMLEHDPMYAVILAFDVKVERDAQELADKEGIKIFSEETIYHLGDRYVEYIKEYKKKKQDEFRNIAVFPCKLKILPDAIFNKRDPIVLGVTVENGILRTGTPLCVPAKEFVEIGVVTSLEFDHKVVEIAKKGVNVCMKVEPSPGTTPKLFGRHFDATDTLVSKISRESIDACKEHFRDDLGKNEWKLTAELKRQFNIL